MMKPLFKKMVKRKRKPLVGNMNCRKRKLNSELADDIMELIFSKLSFLDLGSCRMVCKAWNKLILNCKSSDPKFGTNSNLFFAHISPCNDSELQCVDLGPQYLDGVHVVASFNLSSFGVKIFSSCNGLLLCSSFPGSDTVCLLNPITNEHITVSSPIKDKSEFPFDYRYALGLSLNTNCYKILRYCHKEKPISLLYADVFSFGTTSSCGRWTLVCDSLPFFLRGRGAYFNGALYWVGFSESRPRRPPRDMNTVLRFDLEEHKFEEISFLPDSVKPQNSFLVILDGSMYLTFQYYYPSSEYEVWKMGEDSVWTKVFGVSQLHVWGGLHPFDHLSSLNCIDVPAFQPIKTYEDGKILCLHLGSHLILYDLKTQTARILTRDLRNRKYMLLLPIDCFNFDPLHKILAGDRC